MDVTVLCYIIQNVYVSFLAMIKNTVVIMQIKPTISIGVKGVFKQIAESVEATTGSKVPIKVAFIGPIRRIP